MTEDIDITFLVDFQLNDDELLPLTKCACGINFRPWDLVIGIERDHPTECPHCKRKLYFNVSIRVYEVFD